MKFDIELIKIVGQIAGIGGLCIGIFLILAKEILKKNIFPKFKNEKHSYNLLFTIIIMSWSIAIIGLFIWAFVTFFVNTKKSTEYTEGNIIPAFSIEKPIIQSGSQIVIIPENMAAKKRNDLDVEFDGILFRKSAILISENKWIFDIKQIDNIQNDMLNDGVHNLRLRFSDERFSEPIKIIFFTKTPIVNASIIDNQLNGDNNYDTDSKIISGMAASELQYESEMLKVDFFFQHEGEPVNVEVPVRKIIDPEGKIYFEFLLQIESIPQFSQDDKRYSEPFFALTVTDQAGNKYHDQMSYAQFMSPGLRTFGVGNLANINLLTKHVEIEDKKKSTSIGVQILPDIQQPKQFYNGKPAIILKVNKHHLNMNQLEWSNLPDEIKAKETITTILRNDENIALSFKNKYIDRFAPKDQGVTYQVIQTAKDGIRYSSNIVHQQQEGNHSENTDKAFTNKKLNNFLAQLEPGEWVVIVGSYKNKNLAEEEIEKIKSKYPELFLPQSSELYKRYYENYGAAKYFDGKYWAIYIGGFYSYESANLLRDKAITELGLDEDTYLRTPLIPTEIPDNENISGWLFIGAYNNENKKLYGNIDGYPYIGKQYEFLRRDKLFNIRTDPPKTVNSYYDDLKKSKIIGRMKGGDIFIIKETKEFPLNNNQIKIWAKIKYN